MMVINNMQCILESRYMYRLLPMLLLTLFFQTCITAPEPQNIDLSATDDFSARKPDPEQIDGSFNDFITSVYSTPSEQKQAMVDSFLLWADSATGIPYLENASAIFLYTTSSANSVNLAGDFCGWNPDGQSLNHLSGTNLYYATYEFELDARLDYKLVVNGNWILDPRNPNTCSGGYGPNSELSMPDYIQPEEIQEYDFSHGLLSSVSFSDTTQGRTRNVKIYTPPGYDSEDAHYRTIYFHDGSEYVTLGSARNVLDYLIATEAIPPVIAVFVNPINRNDEYAYDYDFMAMFVNELVPWIDDSYRTMPEAQYRAVAGVSLGGLTSLLFTIQHPEVFGNCGAYSPAIWFGDIIAQYEAQTALPVKIYMDAGTYEPSIYNSSFELLGVLNSNSWVVDWKVWHEGHSWGAWRAHLDESLTFFWPLATSGIDERF